MENLYRIGLLIPMITALFIAVVTQSPDHRA